MFSEKRAQRVQTRLIAGLERRHAAQAYNIVISQLIFNRILCVLSVVNYCRCLRRGAM